MPRLKEDGKGINCHIDGQLVERLTGYAEDNGYTITTALEYILKKYLDKYDENKELFKQALIEGINSRIDREIASAGLDADNPSKTD